MAARKRNGGCCDKVFLKYVLFIFNFLFWISGVAVFGFGVGTIVAKQHFLSLLVTSTYAATTHILVVTGILVFIITFIGCIGILKENRCLLLIYTFSLLVIFLLEVVAGILAYVYVEQVEVELTSSLNDTFMTAYRFEKEKTKAIDDLQRNFGCCGALSEEDWKFSKWKKDNPNLQNVVPDSCCRTESKQCATFDHPSNIYTDGCIDKLGMHLRMHLVILGAVALGLSFVQVNQIEF
ncbi:Tetraspanin-11 [Nymphon striatum]|nr:Tetraspanin-11 [Nymphon striatum]